jgi:hypothetical protein
VVMSILQAPTSSRPEMRRMAPTSDRNPASKRAAKMPPTNPWSIAANKIQATVGASNHGASRAKRFGRSSV